MTVRTITLKVKRAFVFVVWCIVCVCVCVCVCKCKQKENEADFITFSIIYHHTQQQETTTEPRFYYWACWKGRAQQQAYQKQWLIVIHVIFLCSIVLFFIYIYLPPTHLLPKKEKKSPRWPCCALYPNPQLYRNALSLLKQAHSLVVSPWLWNSLTTLVVLMLFLLSTPSHQLHISRNKHTFTSSYALSFLAISIYTSSTGKSSPSLCLFCHWFIVEKVKMARAHKMIDMKTCLFPVNRHSTRILHTISTDGNFTMLVLFMLMITRIYITSTASCSLCKACGINFLCCGGRNGLPVGGLMLVVDICWT